MDDEQKPEEGIKLEFNDNDDAQVTRGKTEVNECFGMVICPHCRIRIEKITLENGNTLDSHRPFCQHVKKDVLDIFSESEQARCPLNYWVRARVLRHQ